MKTKFHEYLTLFRKQRGFTQAYMAEKLKISRSTYTNYEAGNRSPDLEGLERIGEILDCSLDELFGRSSVKLSGMIREEASSYYVNVRAPLKRRDRRLAIRISGNCANEGHIMWIRHRWSRSFWNPGMM